MRGTLVVFRRPSEQGGIIPAYAGNTYLRALSLVWARDHPRVCGEHRVEAVELELLEGSSPRMRGTLVPMKYAPHTTRIIPAYAGNTSG